jgi:hypothetical protein
MQIPPAIQWSFELARSLDSQKVNPTPPVPALSGTKSSELLPLKNNFTLYLFQP